MNNAALIECACLFLHHTARTGKMPRDDRFVSALSSADWCADGSLASGIFWAVSDALQSKSAMQFAAGSIASAQHLIEAYLAI